MSFFTTVLPRTHGAAWSCDMVRAASAPEDRVFASRTRRVKRRNALPRAPPGLRLGGARVSQADGPAAPTSGCEGSLIVKAG
ncbi:hypothetical protein GCM10009562_18420 [Nocardioides aquaticus]